MEYSYSLSAKTPLMKKYRIMTATTLSAGVPTVANSVTDNDDGVAACTTTAAVGLIGVSIDQAISTSAQVATGGGQRSDGINAGFVSLNINPDAVFRAKFTEGATEDTPLVIFTQVSASADGLAPAATIVDKATV